MPICLSEFYSLLILNAPQWEGALEAWEGAGPPPSLCASGMFALGLVAQQGSSLFLPPAPSLDKWAPGASAPLKAIPRLWAGMRGGGCQPRAWTQPFSKEKIKKLKKKRRKKKLIYTESYKAWLGEGALLSESTGHQSISVSCPATPPPSFGAATTSPPLPRWAPFPTLAQADGCDAHPLSLLVLTVDTA